jgi:hypothetical protein
MSLSLLLSGSRRNTANAFVTPRYTSRSSTAAHHAASITSYAQAQQPDQHLRAPACRPSPGRVGFSAGAMPERHGRANRQHRRPTGLRVSAAITEQVTHRSSLRRQPSENCLLSHQGRIPGPHSLCH